MPSLIPLALSLLLSYTFVTTLHKLFFHPLSRTPGPFLCRISTLPSFYHARKGDRHLWIHRNFQRYGDKFRAEPNLILFNTPRAHADIHGRGTNIKRSKFYQAWRRDENDNHTTNGIEPAVHAKRRKLLNLAFTEQSLRAASPLIAGHVERWVQLLVSDCKDEDGEQGSGKGWSEGKNMAEVIEFLVFDMLGELCFGEQFRTKEPGSNTLKKVPHLLMKQIKIGYKLSKLPIFDLILWLQPRGLNKLFKRLPKEELVIYNGFLESSVDKRIAAHKANPDIPKDKPRDIFYFLLNAVDPDTGLAAFQDRHRILSETRLLVIAGTDTTATTLSGLFFYLSRNPTVLKKLTEEIRTTFGTMEEIAIGGKLNQCKYLRAVIDETLRLAHPAPGELPREVLRGGAVIDGQHYPAGTVVGCSGWAMGRNEQVYGPDADRFRPERWLTFSSVAPDEHGKNDIASQVTMKRAFHPFSMGSMNCVGQNLAMLEMLMVVAKTVWATDFELVPGTVAGESTDRPDVYELRDFYLCEKDGPVLRFKPRAW